MPKANESTGIMDSITKKTREKEKKEKKSKKRKRTKDLDAVSPSPEDNKTSASLDAVVKGKADERSVAIPEQVSATNPNPLPKKRKKKRKKDRRVKNPATAMAKEPVEDSTAPSPAVKKSEKVQVTEDSADITFPFPTDPDDHCESPLQAYAHMQPLLSLLAKTLGSGGDKGLDIYDPYYCNGAVIENLAALGFPSVYNKKEDCYQVWASATSYPSFDVLVTNPPYSADHIEKLVNHITSPKMNGRPWFLLMPEWVHKKDYFLSKTKSRQMQPFYVIPKKRYVYLPPKDYRASKKSDVHKKSSPFNSMWYVWGGTREGNDKLMRHFYNSNACTFPVVDNTQKETTLENPDPQRMPLSQVCDLARSKSALRDLRRKHSSKKK